MTDDYESRLAAYRESQRPPLASPTAERVQRAVVRALAGFRPDPAGTIMVAELVAAVRRALPQRYRKRLRRAEVTAALDVLGIPSGTLDRRQVIVGYSIEAQPTLTIEGGKARLA